MAKYRQTSTYLRKMKKRRKSEFHLFNNAVSCTIHRYDKLAFKYVSYVAVPTLAAYTVYSLMYESHKGWYSFIISTLTSFVYMFGFVRIVLPVKVFV